jgi:hypothetical protein
MICFYNIPSQFCLRSIRVKLDAFNTRMPKHGSPSYQEGRVKDGLDNDNDPVVDSLFSFSMSWIDLSYRLLKRCFIPESFSI